MKQKTKKLIELVNYLCTAVLLLLPHSTLASTSQYAHGSKIDAILARKQ